LGLLILVLLLAPFGVWRHGDWHGERAGRSVVSRSIRSGTGFQHENLVSVLTDRRKPLPDRKFAAGQYQLQVRRSVIEPIRARE